MKAQIQNIDQNNQSPTPRFSQCHDLMERDDKGPWVLLSDLTELFFKQHEWKNLSITAIAAENQSVADYIAQLEGERDTALANLDACRRELENISNSNPREWGDQRDSFQAWAQNRARHTLAACGQPADDACRRDAERLEYLVRHEQTLTYVKKSELYYSKEQTMRGVIDILIEGEKQRADAACGLAALTPGEEGE